jgi:HlyD family secretion protein
VPVVIDFTAPRERWAALADGYRVEARIIVDERRGVLHVPLGAIFRHAGGWAVFAVTSGRARRSAVTVGARNDTDVEITGGLDEHASVIVHPSERVKDGIRVHAR